MNLKDVLTLAHKARPDLIEKTAAIMSELDAESEAGVIGEFHVIADVLNEKTAATADFKGLGLAIAGSAAAGLGGALASDLYDAARRGLTKDRNFKRIMEMNPGLKNQVDDPKRLRTAFDTLHRYAPDFTSDPSLGGSVLKSMVNLPEGSEANFISSLISSRSTLVNTRRSQFRSDGAGNALVGDDPDNKHDKDIALENLKAQNQRRAATLKFQQDLIRDQYNDMSDYQRSSARGKMIGRLKQRINNP